jgi:hypothetical protein
MSSTSSSSTARVMIDLGEPLPPRHERGLGNGAHHTQERGIRKENGGIRALTRVTEIGLGGPKLVQ